MRGYRSLGRLAGAIWLTLALFMAAPASSAESLRPGDRAPTFELAAADGQAIKLEALRGRAVLVNFWASWCSPCLRELPLLERLSRSLSERQVTILAINVDAERDAGVGVAKHLKLSMPVVYDPAGISVERFRPQKLPATFIIDREGVIRFVHEGVIDEADLKELEAKLLTLVAVP